jgi:GT2 family glycosyltransferase
MTGAAAAATMDERTPITTTVVMPVYRPGTVLERVLSALEPQIRAAGREAILVESSGDGTADRLAGAYPWLTVVARSERTPQGAARNVGAAEARGALLAFIDADAVPAADWLDLLEEAAAPPDVVAVIGAIENGTPESAIGTAGYLLEFAEWLPERRGVPAHGATCNLLVRRAAFERVGGFLDATWTGEDTLLSAALIPEGRIVFARDARVRHLNRTALRAFLRDQHKHGVGIVAIGRRGAIEHAWVNRPVLAPVALAVKALGVVRVCSAAPGQLRALARVAPVALLGLAAWTVGLVRSGRYTFPHLPYPGADR